jgi:YidC/Oxa1 family membrane protein insertase
MDIKTLFLYAAFAIVSFSLWSDWKLEHPVEKAPMQKSYQTDKRETIDNALSNTSALTDEIIHVKTNVLDLAINLNQGAFVDANLLNFPASSKTPELPFGLFNSKEDHQYFATSSFVTNTNGTPSNIPVIFTTDKTNFVMQDNQPLNVVLNARLENGVLLQKILHFKPNSYVIDIDYKIDNQSDTPWKTHLNQQISWKNPEVPESSMFQIGSYTGASFGQPGKHRYKKVSFDQIKKDSLDTDAKGGWVAMQQHYFLTAWIPNQKNLNRLYTQHYNNTFVIGSVSEPLVIAAHNNLVLSSQLYIGPEDTAILKTLAPGLDLTVDYGWLWFLSDALFGLMQKIYQVIGNWGWSIVLITCLIKLCFYKLSAASYRSMANMRRLQPKLEQLKQRFGDDKAKFSQATMELYRQEKINPLGGCLPILIQIPVFIALYWVLVESVELRHAPFIFWIKDLSASDPLHVLPLIMGLTMFIQQKLNPAQPDPMQAKIMMMMPVFFTILFWGFPSGLVLYWIVNNTLSILQQWWITRKYQDKSLVKAK